jgi:hypothetical protein
MIPSFLVLITPRHGRGVVRVYAARDDHDDALACARTCSHQAREVCWVVQVLRTEGYDESGSKTGNAYSRHTR